MKCKYQDFSMHVLCAQKDKIKKLTNELVHYLISCRDCKFSLGVFFLAFLSHQHILMVLIENNFDDKKGGKLKSHPLSWAVYRHDH